LELSVVKIDIHHRDTEDTEIARRFELYSTLCASSVLSPVSVVNGNVLDTQFHINPLSRKRAKGKSEEKEERVFSFFTVAVCLFYFCLLQSLLLAIAMMGSPMARKNTPIAMPILMPLAVLFRLPVKGFGLP
jgi:hypothetical protein